MMYQENSAHKMCELGWSFVAGGDASGHEGEMDSHQTVSQHEGKHNWGLDIGWICTGMCE